jgi:hypothetical protein
MIRYASLALTLATVLVGLIPLYGILYWGWDTFQMLMLYWIETVVIAFWTMRRLARLPEEQARRGKVQIEPAGFSMTWFFTLHAGIFITVHFVFLWAFFSWDWFQKVHGVGSLFYELLIANGIWIAILSILIIHTVSYLAEPAPAATRIESRVGNRIVRARPSESGDAVMPIIGALYVRIIVLQIGIIFGAVISGFSGSLAPLVIVIVLKALIDLGLGVYTPLKALAAAPDQATS